MHTFSPLLSCNCDINIYIYTYIDICTCWCLHDLIILYASLAAKHRGEKKRHVSSSPGRIESGAGCRPDDHPRVKWVFHAKKSGVHQVEGKVVYRIPFFTRFYTSKVVVWDFFHQQYTWQTQVFAATKVSAFGSVGSSAGSFWVFFYRNKILGLQIDDSLATFMNEWYTRPTFPWNFMSDKLES